MTHKNFLVELTSEPVLNDEAILPLVLKYLSDPFSESDIEKVHEHFTDVCEGDVKYSQAYIGGLGFFLFHLYIDKISFNQEDTVKTDGWFEQCNGILRHAEVKKFMFQKEFIFKDYAKDINTPEIPEEIILHRIGTTSYLLKIQFGFYQNTAHKDNWLALKILKCRYFENNTIENSTKNYKTNYCGIQEYVAKIYLSSERWILMEFIDGLTLKEFCFHKKFLQLHNKNLVAHTLIKNLCNALMYFGEKNIIHSDLNPSNIIIKNWEKLSESKDNISNLEIFFIDFGVNYILNERIGSSKDLASARIYIANEVLTDSKQASVLSDIYSIGVIFLQLLNPGQEINYREIDTFLDKLRLNEPITASILDDLLSEEPEMRLFDFQAKLDMKSTVKASSLYNDIQTNLDVEYKISLLKKKKSKSGLENIFNFIMNFITTDYRLIVNSLKEYSYLKGDDVEAIEEKLSFRSIHRRLGLWNLWAVFMHTIVVTGFIFYLNKYTKQTEIPVQDYLPGLICCLSFSFVALKYYLEIFSYLDSSGLGSFGKLTNIWMRACTLFWPLPIIFIWQFYPALWLYAAFFGTAFVSINNYLTYQLALKSKKEIEKDVSKKISDRMQHELMEFRGWWEIMMWFSIGMLVVGVLIQIGLLVDVAAYAAIVFMANLKLYKYNNVEAGPTVRNTLQFYYSRYYRSIAYKKLYPESVKQKS